jgi:endoglucanase
MPSSDRRTFLQRILLAAAAVPWANAVAEDSTATASPTPVLPARWRGFNLLEKFMVHSNGRFVETDFEWISELGFNFVRLPMDYRCWIEGEDWTKLREETLKEIDEAVEFGRKHQVHVCLNFHRAPGYTVANPPETHELWTDPEAQQVCAQHWAAFAKRYQGIPNEQVSFNLFNEPAVLKPELHRSVVERVLDAIRKEDAERLVICDGRMWGKTPPRELLGLGVAAATRGYEPFTITHYQAEWAGKWEGKPTPTYPLHEGEITWDQDRLRRQCIEPWKKLEAQGMPVMVGEFGAYTKTPHAVVLAWMRDCLDLWKEAGWGFALWNFRGSFGILDSARPDAAYESWRGHQLDRAMLELLQGA